jgi:hypothetical protein
MKQLTSRLHDIAPNLMRRQLRRPHLPQLRRRALARPVRKRRMPRAHQRTHTPNDDNLTLNRRNGRNRTLTAGRRPTITPGTRRVVARAQQRQEREDGILDAGDVDVEGVGEGGGIVGPELGLDRGQVPGRVDDGGRAEDARVGDQQVDVWCLGCDGGGRGGQRVFGADVALDGDQGWVGGGGFLEDFQAAAEDEDFAGAGGGEGLGDVVADACGQLVYNMIRRDALRGTRERHTSSTAGDNSNQAINTEEIISVVRHVRTVEVWKWDEKWN